MAEQNDSQLFMEDGKSIKFYVDPGSVRRRFALILTLKVGFLSATVIQCLNPSQGAGASLVSDPKVSLFREDIEKLRNISQTADIIIVSNTTSARQEFVGWSAKKKVLEVNNIFSAHRACE